MRPVSISCTASRSCSGLLASRYSVSSTASTWSLLIASTGTPAYTRDGNCTRRSAATSRRTVIGALFHTTRSGAGSAACTKDTALRTIKSSILGRSDRRCRRGLAMAFAVLGHTRFDAARSFSGKPREHKSVGVALGVGARTQHKKANALLATFAGHPPHGLFDPETEET